MAGDVSGLVPKTRGMKAILFFPAERGCFRFLNILQG